MDNARRLALTSLIRAEELCSYSNLEINTVIKRSELSKKDISLYTALYMGVTERLMTLDYIISLYSSIDIDKLDTETKNALRLGIYQLMFMDKIPDYSAVSETVELCPKRSKGYVNAVLRGILRNEKRVEYPTDKWEALSVISSTPSYIIDIFRRSYGDDIAIKLCSEREHHSGISLRVNTVRSSVDDLFDHLNKKEILFEKTPLSEDIITVHAPVSDIEDILGEGLAFVQDIASRCASALLDAHAGMRVLDACACPGGKTFSVAMDMHNLGSILACDLHKNKLSLIDKGAKRLGIDIITTREQNGKEYCKELDSSFDRVLCDVPCSGLGVIGKKPDIKYNKDDSVGRLPSIQYAILSNCAKYVSVGGEIVYSTCTLNKAENDDVVSRFLAENDGYETIDFTIGNITSSDGTYTFFPHITDSDGFFVAKIRRVR